MTNAATQTLINELAAKADVAMYSGDRDGYLVVWTTLRGLFDLEIRDAATADRVNALTANMVKSLREPALWA